MRFPRFLRRFLVGYLLLHLLAAIFFLVVVSRYARTQMINDAEGRMQAMALMLRAHVDELPGKLADPSIPEYLKRLGAETKFRFTVISETGVVLADSETGTKDIGPHRDRPEVVQASTQGLGFTQRYSDTLKMPMMYLAIPFSGTPAEPPPMVNEAAFQWGFIRVAAPAVSINQSIAAIQKYILVFALLVSALTAVLMSLFSIRAMKPLQLFSSAARKIGIGQYEEIPLLHARDDEWKTLGDAFSQMRTELKSREMSLTENSRRLQAVLSSMIEGVIAVDAGGVVTSANRAAKKILSLTADELVGRKLVEVVRFPELQEAVQETQQTRNFSKVEFQTLDEPRIRIKARVSVMSDDSEPGVAIVLHDVTELRALENMRRDFVANVSHELKTPLASIKAYAETLRLGAINDHENNLQFVGQIEKQAEVLNNLIQDLLELARVESGNTVFEITDVSLNQTCLQAVQMFDANAANSRIDLVFEPCPDDLYVMADIEGIRTIVTNLISNALHYTSAEGKVSVLVTRDDQNASLALIEVQDTGIGIAPEHQNRVFERFYRVDKARSRDHGGTGLGLSIVKHLSQSFGGTVQLRSQIGKGSTFEVRLPLHQSNVNVSSSE